MHRTLVATIVAATLAAAATEVSAVPSFVRQTGLTCNQCHVSFGGPVPNFTWTGKKFKMNGYRLPAVLEKVEAGEEGSISGRRLNIPIVPYLSFRYQSVFASQSKAPGADTASSITSNPTSRLSFFPGGAIGDNFGLWAEMYITPDGSPTREWSLGLMSFDEFDLRYAKTYGRNMFGASFSNQNIKEVYGFGPFPTLPSNLTRGGVNGWSHPNRGNMYVYGMINDRLILTLGASPGEDNLDWNKNNWQAQVGYAFLNTDSNEAWLSVATQIGNDGIPIVSNSTPTAQRTWAYNDVVPGISALRRPGATTRAYVSGDIGDYVRIEPEARYGFVDRGPHSMEAVVRYAMARETYADNAKAKQDMLGGALRYMFNRTVGGDIMLSKNLRFDYIDYQGATHEISGATQFTGYLKFQPAMNILVNLSAGNSFRSELVPVAQRAGQIDVPRGWSWSLSTDILF